MHDPVTSTASPLVRQFREIVLWPLQLMPIRDDVQIQNHCGLIETPDANNPWREVVDEFTGDPALFQERHYSEFVTFLPFVQRFLYGEGKGRGSGVNQESPIRVFRRTDVAKVRMTYPDPSVAPVTFDVAHVDLYFFYDIDLAILTVEIFADDLPLARAQDTMFRFARGYPTYWEPEGRGGHCLKHAEWLTADDKVLAVSDYEHKDKFLSFACQYRFPCIASHWEFLLEPLVLHHSGKTSPLRYRQIESNLLPLMAYLTMDDPAALPREDFIRLGLAQGPGLPGSLPYSEQYLRDFEQRYYYDRYWSGQSRERPGTRFICSGRVFAEVGDLGERFLAARKTGLQQFRHEYFVLFLISHFHKAALLMLADRMVDALNHLDIGNPESVRHFRRVIRHILGVFLRFTHRYWFHDVSEHVQVKELFHMTSEHLGTVQLYVRVRNAIEDMSQYLDSDALRRQGETMVRLTVVATVGLIGVATTGFLGMNLIAEAESPFLRKLLIFLFVMIPTAAVTILTVLKSRLLSEFFEKIADERAPFRAKLAAFSNVWRTKHERVR